MTASDLTEQYRIDTAAHEFGWRENYSDAGKTVYIRGDYVLTVRWSRHNVMWAVLGKGGANIAWEHAPYRPLGRTMQWLRDPAAQDPAATTSMAPSDLTERVELETLALELGWSINQAGGQTAFGYNNHTLTAWWSDNGCATRAIIHADGRETARREHYSWESSGVGDWVALMLSAIVTSRPAQGATA